MGLSKNVCMKNPAIAAAEAEQWRGCGVIGLGFSGSYEKRSLKYFFGLLA
jgi:hypothetical protein